MYETLMSHFMGLFSSNKSYLGIDIGGSAIKMTELKNEKGRPKLVTYGYTEQETDILHNDSEQAKNTIIGALKLIQEKAVTTTRKAVAALPSYTVFSSVIQLPVMSKKDLTAAVRWEAKKFVPMPIEEMVLDWKILDTFPHVELVKESQERESEKETSEQIPANIPRIPTSKEKYKNIHILLTAAPKSLVQRYIEIFKSAGIELVSLETEAFALERSLIGNDPSPIMTIDMGAVATNISIMIGSIPLINRSIDIGGSTITKTISNSLNIDLKRAEQFKRDFGLSMSDDAKEMSQIQKRIEFMMNSIVNEIRYMMNIYQDQYAQPLEKIILTGGSAWLPQLPNYLNATFWILTFIGDPWAKIIYPVDLKPVLNELGPSFAVSIGLALREIIK